MPLSTFTRLESIAERSEATPGLFNQRFSVLSQNIDQLNSDVSNFAGTGSIGTTQSVLGFSSNTLRAQSGNTVRLVNGQDWIARSYDSGGAVFDVKAFGAIGDGVTDDSGAIQTALNRSASLYPIRVPVFFSRGTYRVASQLTMQYALLQGTGPHSSIIQAATSLATTLLQSPFGDENIYIRGLGFDGNNSTNSTQYLMRFATSADGLVLDDCAFTNSPGGGLIAYGVRRVEAHNLSFHSIAPQVPAPATGINAFSLQAGYISTYPGVLDGGGVNISNIMVSKCGQLGIALWNFYNVNLTNFVSIVSSADSLVYAGGGLEIDSCTAVNVSNVVIRQGALGISRVVSAASAFHININNVVIEQSNASGGGSAINISQTETDPVVSQGDITISNFVVTDYNPLSYTGMDTFCVRVNSPNVRLINGRIFRSRTSWAVGSEAGGRNLVCDNVLVADSFGGFYADSSNQRYINCQVLSPVSTGCSGIELTSNATNARVVGFLTSNQTSGGQIFRSGVSIASGCSGVVVALCSLASSTVSIFDLGTNTQQFLNSPAEVMVTAGSAVLPSIKFDSEQSLGWYRSAASEMALSYGTLVGSIASFTGRVRASTLTTQGDITVGGTGNLNFRAAGGTRYIITEEGPTGAGSLVMQAGYGSGSAGGAINLFGQAHAVRPGSVLIGVGGAAGGYLVINDQGLGGGTSVFTVGNDGALQMAAGLRCSTISVGNSGTAIPAISSMSSLVAAFVIQGSASSSTIVAWTAAQPGDQILTTVMQSGAVSSLSSGLVLHSHCTLAGQIEFRLSNMSTLAQNQSSRTYLFTRISPF